MNKTLEYLGERRKQKNAIREWWSVRHLLGYANWAMLFAIVGPRENGKSYALSDFFCRQFVNKGIPFIWIRLTETAMRKLLQNNAEKLVDPDLRRKYNLDLVTSGNNVYQVVRRSEPDRNGKTRILERKLFARVYAASTFYNDKGSIFDKDFLNDPNMRYNVACDEFQRESGEKNNFDILYALVNQLENLVRSTKDRVRVFFLGNTLEEASDLLCAVNFIPEEFGIFKLKSKRMVIENIAPSDVYLTRRKGTIADILLPTASTFTNKIETDKTLVDKSPLIRPLKVIRFTKNRGDWFTLWESSSKSVIITKYNGEKEPAIAMRPYLDIPFNTDLRNSVIELFDTRSYHYRDLITFKQFQKNIELLKPGR